MAPIAINGRAAARPDATGVERWAREMVARLPALAPGRYVVLMPPPGLARRAGHVWEQTALAPRARLAGARLLLSPANTAPLVARANVVVVHDVAALRDPESYSRAYTAWQRVLLHGFAARARHIVTVSEFSAGEIVAALGVERSRITVIPGGVDARFHPGADADRACRQLGIETPYVLAVGSSVARKNLGALAVTAARLRVAGVAMVVAGGGESHLRGGRQAAGVLALGRVAEDLLPGLYAGARALVAPSRYEGFGLPCLEAMAAGTPVVSSSATSLPEVCGDAAVYADPHNPQEIADAVERVLADSRLRSRLREAGLERVASFTWERCARSLDGLLSSLEPSS